MKHILEAHNIAITPDARIFRNNIEIFGNKNTWWYVQISLSKKRYLLHRIVAMMYVPNPNNFPIVMHLDNDITNNHYTNLIWGTIAMNNLQRDIEWRSKPLFNKWYLPWNKWMTGWENHSSKIIIQKLNGQVIKIWDSIKETKKGGFNPPSVCKCCKWQIKSTGWFTFEYQ